MPLRQLRPAITNSERWNSASFVEQSLYVRLMTVVDDFGRCDGRPGVITGQLFAVWNELNQTQIVSPEQVSLMLSHLAAVQLIELYEVESRKVLQLTQWQERIREGCKSKWPPKAIPPESAGIRGGIPPPTSPSPPTSTITPTSPSPGEFVRELPVKIVQREISKHFNREPDAPWSYEEERLLVDLAKRPKITAEWTEIVAYHTRNKDGYRRQSVLSLLQNWTSELDKARAKPPEVIDVNGHAQANGAMLVLRQKEFERVTAEMQTIKATYGDHQSWTLSDRQRFNTLKDRKKQLKNELGLTA